MRKYANKDGHSQQNQTAFATVMTIYSACKKIGFSKCTPKALMDFLNSKRACGFHIFMSKKIATPPPKLFSVKQPAVPMFQWKGGKLRALLGGEWLNGLK